MTLISYGDAYARAVEMLDSSGVPEAALDARLLLEFVCHTTRSVLYAQPERTLSGEEKDRFFFLIDARCRRIPLARLTGVQDFMGLSFRTGEEVLIPRQDTETLVEEAMPLLFDGMQLMDLCTGTGCIALSLLHYSNDTKAVATDASDKAILIAKQNGEDLGLSGRVTFVTCDLFPDASLVPEKGFDLITANPPYIRTDVIDTLAPEVKEHDPRMALDGGADGLLFYRRIIPAARQYLARGAHLMVETGHDQTEAVEEMYDAAGYTHIRTVRDLSGHPRVVTGSYIGSCLTN